MTNFTGTAGPDTLPGSSGNDSFFLQQGGDDSATGLEGADGFYFGSAYTNADSVDGGTGTDTLALQGNYPALTLGSFLNVEVIAPLPGNDTRFGDLAGNFYSYNITTTDASLAAATILTIVGGNLRPGENLTFNGSAETNGNFRVFAGQGTDNLRGGGGNDGFFFGADGNLTGADRVDGGNGTDSIALRGNYVSARAVLFQNASFSNIEVVTLLSGHTNEFGGIIDTNGFDYDLTMAEGNVGSNQRLDVIAGNLRSNESLRFDGRAETNGFFRVIAGAGDDTIYGSFNTDTLAGGLGNDTLIGGATFGDNFVFNTALGPSNIDSLPDFDPFNDLILLAGGPGQPFADLATGVLGSFAFAIGPAAQDADDRIIYNPTTGALLYDPDGTGSAVATQFATLPLNLDKLGVNLDIYFGNFQVTGPGNTATTIISAATANVVENSAASTIVYQIAFTDADGDRFSYAIEGADAGKFTVDTTGAVRLIASPDFETQSSYDIIVFAYDSAGFFDDQAVRVFVGNLSERVGATPALGEAAGNDTIGTAQAIARSALAGADNAELFDDAVPAARIEGSISVPADVDYYSISLKAGELLILDIDNPVVGLDTVLRIYDADGELITGRDDWLRDPGSAGMPDAEAATSDAFLWFEAPATGTYYFSVESWGPDALEGPGSGETSGAYRLNLSIETRPTAARILGLEAVALLDGTIQPDTEVSFSFPTSTTHYPGYPDELAAADFPGFQTFNESQRVAVDSLLQQFAAVSTLTFQLVAPGPADLRYAMNDKAGGAAYAVPPVGSPADGAMWFGKQSFDEPAPSGYAWSAIIHETGHTLGLKHGHDFPSITLEHDTLEYSVMTYRSYFDDDLEGYKNEDWGYPQTLMMLDIAALQILYGANYEFLSGDTVFQWSATTGETFINGVGQGEPGANRVFQTIWDGGGTDTYNMSNYATRVLIDLRPGEWSLTSEAQLADLNRFGPNLAKGNVANALLFDDDPRSLIENAIGGSGNDFLIANQAANALTGNAGVDWFWWISPTDAGTGPMADRITDFVRGVDKIVFSALDAIAGPPYDNAFTFIGTDAFHSQAGELRYQVEGANLRIQADVDGNGVADMEIILDNLTVLGASDFIF
jgi:serralysin